jgi:hypothetical protein
MQIKTIGFILLGLGVFLMLYTGFTYVTTEKVIDLGAVKISKEKNHFIQWPPVAGVVSLIGGVAVLLLSKRK